MTAAAPSEAGIPLRMCESCGEPFEPNRRGRPRRFCKACSTPGAVSRRYWQRVEHDPRPCVECGEPFTPNRADQIVCSTSCRNGAHNSRPDWQPFDAARPGAGRF